MKVNGITISSDQELNNAFELFPNGPLRISFSLKELALPIYSNMEQPFPLYPVINPIPSLPMEVVQQTPIIMEQKFLASPMCDFKLERRQKKWERKGERKAEKLEKKAERLEKKAERLEKKVEKRARKFGANVQLPDQISFDLETCLAQLLSLGFEDRSLNERLLKKCKNDIHRVVWKLTKKKAKKERKLYKIEKKIRKLDISGCSPIEVCG